MPLKKEIICAPSVLAADFSCLKDGLAMINDSGAEYVHLDIMDGQFVPPITIGDQAVRQLRGFSGLFFDVHLMTLTPENQIPLFADAGADLITFHYEAAVHHNKTLSLIKEKGCKTGISIVPSTDPAVLGTLLPFVDLVLVMTVNPGYGGQSLIPETLDSIRYLKDIRDKKGYSFLIEADGGINLSNCSALTGAGADVLVTGSAFFQAPDKKNFVKTLKGLPLLA
jgi:ribulose-phosphate 3-epimerase